MRRTFADELLKHARQDSRIVVVTCDLGYGIWDQFRDELPLQFYNVGAAEQAGMGIAVGMALSGKKPFIYSITSFLLYRPFETIRNYVDHEQIPVRMVGSGIGRDYQHDGFSHWSEEAHLLFGGWRAGEGPAIFPSIVTYWPREKEDISLDVQKMIADDRPAFIGLRR